MTLHRPAFIVFAAVALLLPGGAQAQGDYEPVIVREGPEGHVAVDLDSVRARSGAKSGWLTLKADIELAKPFHYAAHEVSRETQTQDWDCEGRRYRVVLRTFFTSTGLFVYSERGRSDWKSVPEEGPEKTSFEALCGKD